MSSRSMDTVISSRPITLSSIFKKLSPFLNFETLELPYISYTILAIRYKLCTCLCDHWPVIPSRSITLSSIFISYPQHFRLLLLQALDSNCAHAFTFNGHCHTLKAHNSDEQVKWIIPLFELRKLNFLIPQ